METVSTSWEGAATTSMVQLTAPQDDRGAGGAGGGGGEDGWVSPASWAPPYSLSFQVSITALLLLELVLGFSSNLTVLVLYWSQSGLVDSVSNLVTVNLHVLDVAVCALCVPLTLSVVLLPVGPDLALLCCFHEACVTFASIATAVNILVISLDRYDISVRPANRLLTTRRAVLLLVAVWVTSIAVFFIPLVEMQWPSGGWVEVWETTPGSPTPADVDGINLPDWSNRTLLCVGGRSSGGGRIYFHLLLQVPVFFTTVGVMLFTYSRILQALNIRIGSHKLRNFSHRGCHRTPTRSRVGEAERGTEPCPTVETRQLNHPPIIASPLALSSPLPLATLTVEAATPVPATVGVHASVSAIIALRRAVRRHRDRRERQRRVFRMSLIIITTFLGCWAPLSLTNLLILGIGPTHLLVSLRLCFLVLAYGTTVSHPLLYAFTRQKLRRALRAKVKKRVVSLLQVDPSPGGAPIHNSWVETRKRLEVSEGAAQRLADAL